jgi:hypothetical protein
MKTRLQTEERRPVKEYDLFVPLCYNDGSPIEGRKLQRIQATLLEHFDGLTYFPQPNEGYWKYGGVVYRDEIVVYRILTEKTRTARRFLMEFKARLKRELRQEDILIVERDVDTL